MNQLWDLLTSSRFRHFWANLGRIGLILSLVCSFGLAGCQGQPQASPMAPVAPIVKANLSEVSPPLAIEELNEWFDQYQPQVEILSPRPDEILADTQVTLKIGVKNLPIFRDLATGLGPYLQVTLDNQASRPVYALEKPVMIEDLAPGTHTLRVVAVRPWGESFKTAGAFAQVTFHTLVESDQNSPPPQRPLLTYNQPQGFYGSEPFLLDFYLANAPLLSLGKASDPDAFSDWQVRCTINGISFTVDRWQAFYLTGLKAGKNWVRLELLDGQGRLIENGFNPTIWAVDYQPGGLDARSRLLRGELTAAEIKGVLSPNFESALPPVSAPASLPLLPPPPTEPLESTPIPTPEPEELPTAPATVPIEPAASLPPTSAQDRSQALESNPVAPTEAEDQVTTEVPPTPKGSERSWRNFFRQKPQPSLTPPGLDEESSSQLLTDPGTEVTVTTPAPAMEATPPAESEPEPPPTEQTNTVANPAPGQELEALKKRWQNYLSRPQTAPSPRSDVTQPSVPTPELEVTAAQE
ncbi:hypothetical protein RIF25_16560 [Thermosynechococcaceae cyanobacterium BACA0444]|uniref:FHA domain containing protein n=1 Tax=Pseudocalidococcus azoricus BACA0444 TaxID=2918990 RepID=A0AAE4JXD5_9CYAN|nr:hypothetical protein [Pseudocalidococcus azoricus]MDS3862410.1 hypothetical protein [Pseudocalidococcus azoricus BACA0444]